MRRRVAALAVSFALTACAGDDEPSATPAGPTTTTTTSTAVEPTTTTTAVPSAVEAPASYFSTDGSVPPLEPSCDGLLSFCIGNPVEKVTVALGLEDDRYSDGEGGIVRQWDLEGAFLSVHADEIGSIHGLTVAIDEGRPFLMTLPNGLLLGRSTMGQVADSYGPQTPATDSFSAENEAFYTYGFRGGPEGSLDFEFTYTAEVGSPGDPGGFNDALRSKPFTSATVKRGD